MSGAGPIHCRRSWVHPRRAQHGRSDKRALRTLACSSAWSDILSHNQTAHEIVSSSSDPPSGLPRAPWDWHRVFPVAGAPGREGLSNENAAESESGGACYSWNSRLRIDKNGGSSETQIGRVGIMGGIPLVIGLWLLFLSASAKFGRTALRKEKRDTQIAGLKGLRDSATL